MMDTRRAYPVFLALLCTALWLAAGACATEEPPAPNQGTVELGTGTQGFEPLNNGDDIFVVQGPQGGYHLYGSARISGLNPGNPDDLSDPDNPRTVFRVYRAGQRIDTDIADYVQGYRPVPGTELSEMTTRTVILDIADDAELDGVEIAFEVEVTDVTGAVATDTKNVFGTPHPNNL